MAKNQATLYLLTINCFNLHLGKNAPKSTNKPKANQRDGSFGLYMPKAYQKNRPFGLLVWRIYTISPLALW